MADLKQISNADTDAVIKQTAADVTKFGNRYSIPMSTTEEHMTGELELFALKQASGLYKQLYKDGYPHQKIEALGEAIQIAVSNIVPELPRSVYGGIECVNGILQDCQDTGLFPAKVVENVKKIFNPPDIERPLENQGRGRYGESQREHLPS